MTEIQKSIKHQINRTIPWRTELQSRFPDDPRNETAVDLLEQFSVDVDNMTAEQLEKVASHFSWDETWYSTLRNVVRRVGYQRTIQTFDGFLDSLAINLKQAKAAA